MQHVLRFLCALVVVLVAATVIISYVQTRASRSAELVFSASAPVAAIAVASQQPYPRTPPVYGKLAVSYKIALIADLDRDSKLSTNGSNAAAVAWRSLYLPARLSVMATSRRTKRVHSHRSSSKSDSRTHVTVNFESGEPLSLVSHYAYDGRGMELSELIAFNGRLLAPDDRTGILYDLGHSSSPDTDAASPWIIMADGDGSTDNGFKGEWATVKDGELYIGGMGKMWTSTDGSVVINHNPMWIKIVSADGSLRHVDWQGRYEALMRAATVHHPPGYMIHEAVAWSDVTRRWLFAPRRISRTEAYDDIKDETRGANLVLIANEDFSDIVTVEVKFGKTTKSASAETTPVDGETRGFSSIKFVPGTGDRVVVALRSEEFRGKVTTHISAFDLNGNLVMDEMPVARSDGIKYEGIEFV